MKYILVVILLSLTSQSAKSQSGDDCKYLMVLTYLRTNQQINEQIKGTFSGNIKKRKRAQYVEFNLSDQIEFIQINDFKDSLQMGDYGIDKELINDYKLFTKKYYFKPFKSDFLEKLIEENDSPLHLTFSKPIGNILIAAIGNLDPKPFGVNQFGVGLTMLFKFDSLGLIEHVFYYGAIYR